MALLYRIPASYAGGLAVATGTLLLVFLTACGSGTSTTPPPPQQFTLTKVSMDTFTDDPSEYQHATEVEADLFSNGSTIVSAFQVGRRTPAFDGGAEDLGFATSQDGGETWTSGFLPGITLFDGGGLFNATSDPTVAYDAKHAVWLIGTVSIIDDPFSSQVQVSSSADALTWENPVIANTDLSSDHPWVVCDDGASSPYFGNCYVQWEDPNVGTLFMNTSSDGGQTWGPDTATLSSALGTGNESIVLPNGVPVIPILSWDLTQVLSLTSSDGGTSWNDPVVVSTLTNHVDAGGIRSLPEVTATIDNTGQVYFVWPDCRFRTNCSSNDLVMSTSTDGVSWTSPVRVPIDPLTSTVDHFLPGLGVDPATGGATAQLTLIYYFYPQTNCTVSDCSLEVGFVSSQDGGDTWSAAQTLAGPMSLSWLPETGLGYMAGDYLAVAYANGNPFSVFAVADANSGSTFDEPMYTTTQPLLPLTGAAHSSSQGERPVPNAKSERTGERIQHQEHESPNSP